MKYLKLYEEIDFDEDDWEWEGEDKTKYRIITLNYASSRLRMLQFKKVENKKTFWGKQKKEEKWFFIPNGEYIQIYKKETTYPVGNDYKDSISFNPYRYIYIGLKSDDSDEYLIKWAKNHPQIEEYLDRLDNEYQEIKRKETEERNRINNIDNETEYLDL